MNIRNLTVGNKFYKVSRIIALHNITEFYFEANLILKEIFQYFFNSISHFVFRKIAGSLVDTRIRWDNRFHVWLYEIL